MEKNLKIIKKNNFKDKKINKKKDDISIKKEHENNKESKAVIKYLRISPQKLRSVVNEIRGKELKKVFGILKFSKRKASSLLIKIIKSAESNAINNNNLKKDNLFISKIYVGEGPTLKRLNPRAMGRADTLLKRTSHVTVILTEREGK